MQDAAGQQGEQKFRRGAAAAKRRRSDTHTWSTVVLLHPDVTVALGNTCLGVQEGETHGALGAQAGIVAAAVFNGFFIKLLTEAATARRGGGAEDKGVLSKATAKRISV